MDISFSAGFTALQDDVAPSPSAGLRTGLTLPRWGNGEDWLPTVGGRRPETPLIAQRRNRLLLAADHLAIREDDAVFAPALDAAAIELLAV